MQNATFSSKFFRIHFEKGIGIAKFRIKDSTATAFILTVSFLIILGSGKEKKLPQSLLPGMAFQKEILSRFFR